jgi:hypothetical protein
MLLSRPMFTRRPLSIPLLRYISAIEIETTSNGAAARID